MEPVRLAVIGTGLIGEKHAKLVSAHSGGALVGLCDVAPNHRSTADALGVPFYQHVEELLERERPEGAIVATPNHLHATVAEVCARRAVHILVEKPIGDTLEAASRIVEVAEKNGVQVLVGHHRRHNPLLLQLEHFYRVIRNGEKPLVDGCDGRRSLEVALAVLESAQHQMPIALPEYNKY